MRILQLARNQKGPWIMLTRELSQTLQRMLQKILWNVKCSEIFLTLAILFTLALMEHINPAIVDDLLSLSPPEQLLLFLVDAMYSPQLGLFQEIPRIMTSLENSSNSLDQAQRFDSNILQPYIARISSIISRVFGVTQDSRRLALGIDKYLGLSHHLIIEFLPQHWQSIPQFQH